MIFDASQTSYQQLLGWPTFAIALKRGQLSCEMVVPGIIHNTFYGGDEKVTEGFNIILSQLPKDSLHNWSGTTSSGDPKRAWEKATYLLGHHLLHHVKDDVAQGAGEM